MIPTAFSVWSDHPVKIEIENETAYSTDNHQYLMTVEILFTRSEMVFLSSVTVERLNVFSAGSDPHVQPDVYHETKSHAIKTIDRANFSRITPKTYKHPTTGNSNGSEHTLILSTSYELQLFSRGNNFHSSDSLYRAIMRDNPSIL